MERNRRGGEEMERMLGEGEKRRGEEKESIV